MNQKIKALIFIAIAVFLIPLSGGAQTTNADLLAQIRALQAQLNQLIAQLGGTTIAPSPATPPVCSGILFSRNLIVGSTGTDVRCLQAILNQSADTLVAVTSFGSPGLETLFFGNLTRAAVIRFQNKYASRIITLSGYSDTLGFVGPATRALLNNLLLAPTVPTGGTGGTGTPGGTGTTVGGIVMNGQEGNLTVSVNPTPANNTKVYEGNTRVAVMGVQLRATGSDLSVQRATLGFDARPQNFFSTIYLYDGNTVVDSINLNDSTVNRVSATRYTVNLTDFNNPVVVREGTARPITVRVDVQNGISSGVLTDSSANIDIYVAANGIRAMDQAGLSDFAPGNDSTVIRTINVNRSLSTSATLTISTDPDSPAVGNLIADSDNTVNGATVLIFNATAQRDNLLIDEIDNVTFTTGAGFLVPQTVYLYDDNGTIIDSATPNQQTGIANFNNISVEINQGTTRTFMIKIDDTLAANGADNGKRYRVTMATDNGSSVYFTVERANGALLSAGEMSGSVTSFDQFALQSGPIFDFTVVSTSQIPVSGYSPSAISAVFTIRVTARGSDIYLPITGAFHVTAIRNNEASGATVTSTVYRASNVSQSANSYRVAQDTTSTFTINSTYTLGGPSGTYHLKIDRIDWGFSDASPATQAATYMDNFVSGFEYLQ